MSDPVTNAEIEDVLSSIRRLVSENASSRRPAKPEGQTLDKLVLTPAFRVSDSDAGPDAAPVVDATRGEPEPEADGTAGDAGDRDTAPPHRASDLEERIAELEAAVGRSYGGFEPDGSAYDSQSPEAMVYEPAGAELGWGEGMWATDPIEESGGADAAAPDAAEDQEASALETEAAPEETGADELAEMEARTEVDETGGDTAEDEAEDELDPVLDYSDETVLDETVLDEEALRELVSRLVREELQGSVGERITRNVRRLVRREIQRALSLREFE